VENTGTHTFQLPDASGDLHQYLVIEHPAGEGMAVMYELLAMGSPTVLSLAAAALKSEDLIRSVVGAVSGDEAGLEMAELGKMLAGLDLSSVGPAIERALGTGKAPELTRQVLAHTFRDGKPLKGTGLDLAYQANYGELLQAVWRVCSINRFFPVPSTSSTSPDAPSTQALPLAATGG
jgi:hypothetical protein